MGIWIYSFFLPLVSVFVYQRYMLYSLHNGLHKYTPMERQRCSCVCCASCWPAVLSNFSVLVGCALALVIPLASGGVPQGLTLFRGVRLIDWRQRFPSLGNAEVFLKMLGTCGLRPCARTQLKGLVPYSSGWCSGSKYNWPDPRDTPTCDTSCVVDW